MTDPLSPEWFDDMGEKAYAAAYDHNTDVIRSAVAGALEWCALCVEQKTGRIHRLSTPEFLRQSASRVRAHTESEE